jgi:THO complex subunit 1
MSLESSRDAFLNASKSAMPFHELSDLTHDKFISSLPDPLSSLVQQASEISFVSNRSDHFEILTRSHVLEITEKILDAFKSNDEGIIEEGMVELISFIRSVIDFSLYIAKRSNLKDAKNDEWSDMDSAQMRKVPFLLLEDSFDSLPLSLTRILWTYGPAEWLPNICDETLLFNQGSKYVLIRVANKLLKSLSVNAENQAASFAGEISMTLAAVFPLSERSAVNVLGSFHTDNIVKFESMEEWIEKKGSEKEQQELVMNYDFYSKLWGVQQTFTNPKELLPLGSTNWNENLDNFLEEVKFIFSLFEGRKFKSDLIKHLNAR